MREGAVGALPRLVPLGQLRLRLGGGNLALGVLALGARQRPDLDVLHQLVAELLVEREGAGVLDDHLEPDPPHAALPRLLVQRAHQRLADAGAARARDHADAADPGVLAAQAEVPEADRLAVAEGDARGVEVEVERVVHECELLLVDVEREEVALVRGVEEGGALGRRERARGAELEVRGQSQIPGVPGTRATKAATTVARIGMSTASGVSQSLADTARATIGSRPPPPPRASPRPARSRG